MLYGSAKEHKPWIVLLLFDLFCQPLAHPHIIYPSFLFHFWHLLCIMNILLRVLSILLKKLGNKTLNCIWLDWMLIPFLPTSLWSRPLTCVDTLCKDSDIVNNLTKTDFRKLLNISTGSLYFCFDSTYYKQLDGVAIGSPLGPSLANAFLCHHEKIWLENCLIEFKPAFYRRYVDDSQHVNIWNWK